MTVDSDNHTRALTGTTHSSEQTRNTVGLTPSTLLKFPHLENNKTGMVYSLQRGNVCKGFGWEADMKVSVKH